MEAIMIVKQDISKLLKDLELCKAHGCHEVSPYELKGCAETCYRQLEMFRKSSEEGSLPKYWKLANVSIFNP